jgi:hypothetical protein
MTKGVSTVTFLAMLLITAVCGYTHYFDPSLNFLCYALIAMAVGTAFVASGVYFVRGGP